MYLNDTCQSETSDLESITISSTTSMGYWHESLGDEFIELKNHDFTIDIYPYANASLATNPLCDWRMLSAQDK